MSIAELPDGDADGEQDDEQEGECDYASAREYVEDRLSELQEPITPSELADEYECSSAHMRHTLRDLLDDGEAERVAHGEYVGVEPGEDTEEGTESPGVERASEANSVEPDVSTEDPDPSAGGGPPSEDRDTEEEEGLADDENDGDGWGIPLPCSTTTLAVGVVLALVILWWMTRDSGESGQQTGQQAPEEGEEWHDDLTGGLTG